MLKIDGEEFDNIMEKSLTADNEYKRLIFQIKELTNETDDSLINSYTIRIFEIAYQRAFKDGMNFIIKREELNLFY
ncbi:MAG TPA: hypothetical protein DEG71_11840 [Clostridiales bacterium]|nr:hypothetical protein [Clostridiales bacterium]